jgi:hypothetical protein
MMRNPVELKDFKAPRPPSREKRNLDGDLRHRPRESTLDEDDHVPNIAWMMRNSPSRELGRAGASLGFRPASRRGKLGGGFFLLHG